MKHFSMSGRSTHCILEYDKLCFSTSVVMGRIYKSPSRGHPKNVFFVGHCLRARSCKLVRSSRSSKLIATVSPQIHFMSPSIEKGPLLLWSARPVLCLADTTPSVLLGTAKAEVRKPPSCSRGLMEILANRR